FGGMRRHGHAFRHDFFAGLDLAAKRCHLDHFRSEADVREPEAPADDPAVAKEFLDLIRVRGGADVEVLRPPPQQQVADAAADEIGDVVELAEAVEDFQSVRIDVAPRDWVLGARYDPRLCHVAIVPKGPVVPSRPWTA